MAYRTNIQPGPVITPPQLPYEVYQAQAGAGVVPGIAKLGLISDIIKTSAGHIEKKANRKRRKEQLAGVFKAIDSDKDLPKGAAEAAKYALMQSAETGEDPNAVFGNLVDLYGKLGEQKTRRDLGEAEQKLDWLKLYTSSSSKAQEIEGLVSKETYKEISKTDYSGDEATSILPNIQAKVHLETKGNYFVRIIPTGKQNYYGLGGDQFTFELVPNVFKNPVGYGELSQTG